MWFAQVLVSEVKLILWVTMTMGAWGHWKSGAWWYIANAELFAAKACQAAARERGTVCHLWWRGQTKARKGDRT